MNKTLISIGYHFNPFCVSSQFVSMCWLTHNKFVCHKLHICFFFYLYNPDHMTSSEPSSISWLSCGSLIIAHLFLSCSFLPSLMNVSLYLSLFIKPFKLSFSPESRFSAAFRVDKQVYLHYGKGLVMNSFLCSLHKVVATWWLYWLDIKD